MKKSDLVKSLINFLEAGYSIKDIASELNLSAGYLYNFLSTLYLIYDCKNSRGLLAKKSEVLQYNTSQNL